MIRLKGGLGNQMFQYATGRALSLKKCGRTGEVCENLKLDITGYKGSNGWDTPREYALGVFNIKATIATEVEVRASRTLWFKIINRLKMKFSDPYKIDGSIMKILNSPKVCGCNRYFEGFWQSEKYFKDIAEIIRKDFTLKNPLGKKAEEWKQKILTSSAGNSRSISIHIRRTDYVTNIAANKMFGVCDIDYYKKAFEYITNNVGKVKIFVFSDDISWVKENLQLDDSNLLAPMEFVTDSSAVSDAEELYLMSLCSHHIIANSSFSWWGAWLDAKSDKIVVAPKYWIADQTKDTSAVVPPEWIRL